MHLFNASYRVEKLLLEGLSCGWPDLEFFTAFRNRKHTCDEFNFTGCTGLVMGELLNTARSEKTTNFSYELTFIPLKIHKGHVESQLSSHNAPFNCVLIDNHFPEYSKGWFYGMTCLVSVPHIVKGTEITFGHRDFHLIAHFGFNLIWVNCAGVAPWEKHF